jgi:hypothetical protein
MTLTPCEIMNKIQDCQVALTKGNMELKTLGIKKAEAERNYRIALSKKLFILRTDKYPLAIIQDVAKGSAEISDLRLQRDIAEVSYSVCLEAMRNLRLELEAYRSFLTWERIELKNT